MPSCRFRGPLGARLLQRRGSLILRKLSLLLGPQKVFCALADILNQERDLRFASAMVQALNVILLTAPEVIAHTQLCFVLVVCFPCAVAEPFVMMDQRCLVHAQYMLDLPGAAAPWVSTVLSFQLLHAMHSALLLSIQCIEPER